MITHPYLIILIITGLILGIVFNGYFTIHGFINQKSWINYFCLFGFILTSFALACIIFLSKHFYTGLE